MYLPADRVGTGIRPSTTAAATVGCCPLQKSVLSDGELNVWAVQPASWHAWRYTLLPGLPNGPRWGSLSSSARRKLNSLTHSPS